MFQHFKNAGIRMGLYAPSNNFIFRYIFNYIAMPEDIAKMMNRTHCARV
jgi:hypothetical protein